MTRLAAGNNATEADWLLMALLGMVAAVGWISLVERTPTRGPGRGTKWI